MAALAEEVEALRNLLRQARKIRFNPDVGFVEVRHVIRALQELDAITIVPHVELAAWAER